MLAGVIEIDNVDRARKVDLDNVSNPFRAIADHNLLDGAAPTAIPGFQVDALAELLGCFDGSGIGSRIRITNGVALLIPSGLREDASQLDFARMRRLSIGLPFSPFGFFLHHGNACAVHLDMENGNGLAYDHGISRCSSLAISSPMD